MTAPFAASMAASRAWSQLGTSCVAASQNGRTTSTTPTVMDADGNDRGGHQGADRHRPQCAQDVGQLLSDQEEDEALEDEFDQLPDRASLQPRGTRFFTAGVVADDEPGGDHGEHP
nr:hypothetical protein [Flexivirga caeni]